MNRTYVKDLPRLMGQRIMVQGFVDAVRDQKFVQFVVMNDASGSVQLVSDKGQPPSETNTRIGMLTPGSTVTAVGELVQAPKVKLGGLEVRISDLEIHSIAQAPLPIHADSSQDLLIDYRQVSLRRPDQQLIYAVQTTAEAAMYDFWAKEGFTVMHTPKLMGAASESGAEVFKVDYFGRNAYLAQSPQFYKQMAIAGGVERFAEIGPVFRADPSATSRHNSEFVGIDMEVAWIDSHEDVMQLEERFLRHVFSAVAAKNGQEIEKIFGVKLEIPLLPFPRIPLEEGKKILAAQGHHLGSDDDLDPQAERMLAQHVKTTMGSDFFFATDYPASVRAFYHMRYEDRPNVTKSFDLIYKGLEITTGAQREHRIEKLQDQACQKGLDPDNLKDYFSFFAYGIPPHGGLGIGLARLLSGMLDQKGVTPVTLLPRTMTRLTP